MDLNFGLTLMWTQCSFLSVFTLTPAWWRKKFEPYLRVSSMHDLKRFLDSWILVKLVLMVIMEWMNRLDLQLWVMIIIVLCLQHRG